MDREERTMKKLVYTVVTSNHYFLPKIKQESEIDYYCITNIPNLQFNNWCIKYIKEESLSSPMFLAKYKILGDAELEQNYDMIIYIDASLDIRSSLKEIIKENCNFETHSIYFLNHAGDCTYQMAEEYIHLGKNPAVIRTQMDYYQKQNFPKKFGFVSDKIIIRKPKKEIKQMQKSWYQQVEQFSPIETLSLMYALWNCKTSYGEIHTIEMEKPFSFDKQKHTSLFGNGFSNELGLEERKNKYEPNNYSCHIEDKNDSHSIIARQVKDGSTVLDIGCGVGIIGELLYKNKQCINYGIEIDSEAADIAQKSNYYQKVFAISIDDPEERKIIEKENIKFDYIILADVLEHVLNPTETLYHVSKWLTQNGKIIVSVPNIAYADIIKGLLNHTFNYQKTGILDSTHLHFFTKKSFIEMVANFRITYQTNFDVKWIESTVCKDSDFILEDLLEGTYSVVQNIYVLSKLTDEIPIQMLNELKQNQDDNYQKLQDKIINYIELEKQTKILKEKNKILENEIQSILQSKSWKITSPLRKISKNMIKK